MSPLNVVLKTLKTLSSFHHKPNPKNSTFSDRRLRINNNFKRRRRKKTSPLVVPDPRKPNYPIFKHFPTKKPTKRKLINHAWSQNHNCLLGPLQKNTKFSVKSKSSLGLPIQSSGYPAPPRSPNFKSFINNKTSKSLFSHQLSPTTVIPSQSLNETESTSTLASNNSTTVDPPETKAVKVVEDRQIVLVPG